MRAPITPSSLKWLLTRRARVAGELQKLAQTEAQNRKLQRSAISSLTANLKAVKESVHRDGEIYRQVRKTLRDDLASIDRVLGQHEVIIDPTVIQPVWPHSNARITGYGHITRLILERLRYAGAVSCTTTEVAVHVRMRLGWDADAPPHSWEDLRYRVRKRLQKMVGEGKVQRTHAVRTGSEGRWRLALTSTTRPATRAHRPGDGLANSRATTATSPT